MCSGATGAVIFAIIALCTNDSEGVILGNKQIVAGFGMANTCADQYTIVPTAQMDAKLNENLKDLSTVANLSIMVLVLYIVAFITAFVTSNMDGEDGSKMHYEHHSHHSGSHHSHHSHSHHSSEHRLFGSHHSSSD